MTLYKWLLVALSTSPSLGTKYWHFLTLQKKNKSDLKHLQSDGMNVYKQRYLSISVIFIGFKDWIVMNIYG